MRKLLTLCLPVKDGKVLLGMKKRGFGTGKWNGFGGKIEAGETVEEAAARELFEESGLRSEVLECCAHHLFTFESGNSPMDVTVFFVRDFSGEPAETEEMLPRWFAFDEIPYDQMWTDDRYWLPQVLRGERLKTRFHFATDEKTILSHDIEVLSGDDGTP